MTIKRMGMIKELMTETKTTVAEAIVTVAIDRHAPDDSAAADLASNHRFKKSSGAEMKFWFK
jgi:hypothetical protein